VHPHRRIEPGNAVPASRRRAPASPHGAPPRDPAGPRWTTGPPPRTGSVDRVHSLGRPPTAAPSPAAPRGQ
jgi:hypothetical protein